MIDDISFGVEGFNKPTLFINCREEAMQEGYDPVSHFPTVYFPTPEIWFHKETSIVDFYDEWEDSFI